MPPPVSAVAGRRWTSAAGAWLAIGTSPGALVLGAGLGARHGGPVGLTGVLAGGLLMAALLLAQGRIGLLPPYGDGRTLSAASPSYLPPIADRALNALLALAMIGWFGFNVGLGGAAFAALVGLPGPAGAVLLGGPIVAVAFAGGRWNALAIVTTTSSLILVGLIVVVLSPPTVPLSVAPDGWSPVLGHLAAFLGYVSVFAVRAPDFSVGLRRRRDLGWCVGLLVVPTLVVATAGAGLAWTTGTSEVVAALAGPGGLAVANLFVAASVIAPAFTTTYSGPLALRRVTRLGPRAAVLVIGAPGLVLAVLRFDLLLLTWLALLAAVLPPLVIPMATEAARRRRGHAARKVPTWTWAPGAVVSLALTALDVGYAPLVGLALAGLATGTFLIVHSRGFERGP